MIQEEDEVVLDLVNPTLPSSDAENRLYPKVISYLILAIGVTRLLDVLTTFAGFQMGFSEGNPFAVLVMGQIWFLGLVVLEVAIFLSCA